MSTNAKSSQDFVPIKEVRDGVAVLQDKSMRAILMTSSLNFALQSEDNQTAIVAQFQSFLNSLDFSIQIFIQSRRMDIKPYLALLEERYRAQESDLMKIQTREYIEFIRTFIEGTNIMTKTFFVVIPYGTSSISLGKNPLEAVTDLFSPKKKSSSPETRASDNFEEQKIQLQQRVSVVEQGLIRCGLRTAHLGSEELVELYYKMFNPGETDKPIPVQ